MTDNDLFAPASQSVNRNADKKFVQADDEIPAQVQFLKKNLKPAPTSSRGQDVDDLFASTKDRSGSAPVK